MAFTASPTHRVMAFALPLAAVAAGATTLPRPSGLAGSLHLSWLVFVALFGLTEAFVVKVRMRGEVEGFSLSEVPLVIGLFTTTPSDLVLGRMVAGLAAFVLFQRKTPVKSVFNTALVGASTGVAVSVFWLLLGDRQDLWPVSAGAVLAAMTASGLLEGSALALVGAWYGGRRTVTELVRDLSNSVIVAVVVSSLGLATVYALFNGAASVPLAVTGVAGVLGYRSFAALSDRHASLERLYVLSDALAVAPGSDEVVASVLTQSTDLLRASYGEIALSGLGSGTIRWWMRHNRTMETSTDGGPGPPENERRVTGDRLSFPPSEPAVVSGTTPAEKEFLADRALDHALVVPLRVDDTVTGHLVVGDRRSEERAFALADARLLETVANHAVVALRNGRLLQRLHFEARHDELTGLPNRLDLHDRLETLADAAAAGGPGVSVMVIDFNGFKAINDTLGHQAGDELLQVLAQRFGRLAGDDAVVARMGGDEFAVLSTTCAGADCAVELANRLLSAFDDPVAINGNRLRLGGSLGIALGPRDGLSGSDLLRNADIAMYSAKRGDRGVRMFSPELVEVSTATLVLASDVQDAIDQHQISVAVMPLVHLDTGVIHSVEVLARWRHPQQGEIAPEVFFVAAERAGLVTQLSAQVLDQALARCHQWLAAGRPVRVAVNLAPRWLADSSLPDQVAQALGRHSVPADLLCLEIIESSVIADPHRAIRTLERLREMGVHLSVDDFGTGYSSMTYLSRLPVDQMKIDKSFIGRMLGNHRDRAIVRSIVDLGRNLGLEVVAEGVTDPGIRDALREMGCGLAQGHLFSRPVDADRLLGMIDEQGVVGARATRPHQVPR